MRINTNVAALNSYNQLKNTQNNLSRSLERLSSGKRINGAADDAAGLAISEKMGSQVRGLGQAQRNAQDGISMIQTAEGALKESHSILQRMRELAVQSANDTNTEADRGEIQKEVDQLAKELTRIGETTEFNTQKLLDGTLDDTKFQIGANEGQNMEVAINDMQAEALGVAGSQGAKFGNELTDVASFNGTAPTDSDVALNVGTGGSTVETTYSVKELSDTTTVTGTDATSVEANYSLTDSDGKIVAVSNDGTSYSVLESATEEGNLETAEIIQDDTTASGMSTLAMENPIVSGEVSLSVTDTAGEISQIDVTSATATISEHELTAGEYTVSDVSNNANIGGSWSIGLTNEDGEVVALGATDLSGNAAGTADAVTTYVDVDDVSNAVLNVDDDANVLSVGDNINVGGAGLDVSTQTSADNAISTLDDAIANVSAERSKLGAVQNRLDHTINNLNTAQENLTAAESRISDVDMAKEMMNMSKQQILSQAGTAMMAQANQLPQGVLQLLG